MLIYSIVPPEMIFKNESSENKYFEAKYKGINLEVYRYENSSIVTRIISTDPKDYLINSIRPGLEISNNELIF